ncbi:MAG: heme-binding domain-containing protein [Calditrichia bacterium]|nr:heme-binding domain-containing protein [Calditrichota bacterium]MCB9067195.1 heme-binding domain-containing protein [Calditrichia bacterium]
MKRIKKTLLVILAIILIVFITIQFIQPARNISGQVLQTDMSNIYNIPQNVSALFKNDCYDCHSNNTNYPWYSKIQPVGWLLEADIKNGKAKLNFSEFGSLSSRRKISKLRNIESRIKDGTMPLQAYQLMHPSAQLTKEEKQLLIDWIQNTRDSIALKR